MCAGISIFVKALTDKKRISKGNPEVLRKSNVLFLYFLWNTLTFKVAPHSIDPNCHAMRSVLCKFLLAAILVTRMHANRIELQFSVEPVDNSYGIRMTPKCGLIPFAPSLTHFRNSYILLITVAGLVLGSHLCAADVPEKVTHIDGRESSQKCTHTQMYTCPRTTIIIAHGMSN